MMMVYKYFSFRYYRNMMEKQNIKSYLQYFPKRDIIRHSPKRTRPKLLPHIVEEYQYRITNHLLINKIISPKRDKLIVNSLTNIRRNSPSSKSQLKIHAKGSLIDTIRRSAEYKNHSEYRAKTADFRKNKKGTSLSQSEFNNSHYQQKMILYENSIQNQSNEQKQQKTHVKAAIYRSLHQTRTTNKSIIPSVYGLGPTVLSIHHIQLITNPLLKPNTLTQLELIQKYALSNSLCQSQDRQKVVRTQPIQYSKLPNQDRADCKVKFALKVSKIGDFVPLRLWKYCGVQCVELGTIDIPLSLYREGLANSQAVTQMDNLTWQYKQGSTDSARLVLNGEVSCQLRGTNCQQMQAKVSLKYKVYSKRYTKLNQQNQSVSQH